jgi:hypothetical protein
MIFDGESPCFSGNETMHTPESEQGMGSHVKTAKEYDATKYDFFWT